MSHNPARLVVLGAAIALAGLASAMEINVPYDYPKIQQAISAALDGDTVIVSPGLYEENIEFPGKSITVRSLDPNDPAIVDATTISSPNFNPCMQFRSGTGPNSVVTGLTLKNGLIFAVGSAPVITRNHIIATSWGEVALSRGSPMIVENSIQNADPNGGRPALFEIYGPAALVRNNLMNVRIAVETGTTSGSPLISGNTILNGWISAGKTAVIENNTITGGSIFARDSVFVSANVVISSFNDVGISLDDSASAVNNRLIGCGIEGSFERVTGNYVANGGYGIVISPRTGAVALIDSNTVASNAYGGVSHSGSGIFQLTNNLIVDNGNGGISLYGSGGVIARNLIAGNRGAPAVRTHGSLPMVLDNNTICFNTGGAFDLTGGWYGKISITNNVFYRNPGPDGIQLSVSGENIEFRNNLLPTNSPGAVREWSPATWGPGNIDADPLFVDPGHWNDNGTPDDPSDDKFILGDYHILPGSPCIDAGTNDIDNPDTPEVETLPATDIAGIARVIDGNRDGTATVDMGAYEYLPGDVNYDGKVNVLDLLLVRNSICRDPASSPAARKADLNNDGKVNVLDLIAARNGLQQ